MDRPIISTTEGKIQGTTRTSVMGQDYLAFLGIPYAQPPVGPLRFKDPQEPLKWSGIRDGSKHGGDVPYQHLTNGPKPYEIIGSEDCLYLNLYTKSLGHKKPVMLFIHGGAFVEDTGNDSVYRQDYLVTLDIVLIKVNYRLGPFGFFTLGCETATGNQGLKDMVMALKWVQKNVEAFGGDPNNVTIFGNSAGAGASHILTMVPAAKGLFHKAIIQSGSIFMNKRFQTETSWVNGFRIAEKLGNFSKDPEEVMEFLRSIPPRKFIELEGNLLSKQESEILGIREYGPVNDRNYCKNPFIPYKQSELVKKDANIPIIVGYTADECLLSFMCRFNDETYKFYDENLNELMKTMVLPMDKSKYAEFLKDIKKLYFKDKPINKDNVWDLIKLFTDFFFLHPKRKMVDIRNEHAKAPTYFYRFSYMGNEPTIYQVDQGPQPLKGAAHADELSYMFFLTYLKTIVNSNDYPREGTNDGLIMERLLKMWYNFAATGNPTPETDGKCITTIWEPTSKDKINYLDIDINLKLNDDKDLDSRVIFEKYKEYI